MSFPQNHNSNQKSRETQATDQPNIQLKAQKRSLDQSHRSSEEIDYHKLLSPAHYLEFEDEDFDGRFDEDLEEDFDGHEYEDENIDFLENNGVLGISDSRFDDLTEDWEEDLFEEDFDEDIDGFTGETDHALDFEKTATVLAMVSTVIDSYFDQQGIEQDAICDPDTFDWEGLRQFLQSNIPVLPDTTIQDILQSLHQSPIFDLKRLDAENSEPFTAGNAFRETARRSEHQKLFLSSDDTLGDGEMFEDEDNLEDAFDSYEDAHDPFFDEDYFEDEDFDDVQNLNDGIPAVHKSTPVHTDDFIEP